MPGDCTDLQSTSREVQPGELYFPCPDSGKDCRNYLGIKKLLLLLDLRRKTVSLSTTWHMCFGEAEEACGVSIIIINNFLRGGGRA